MTRSTRIFLNDVNIGKVETLKAFTVLCRNITQFFVDLFWQRQDFSGSLADLPTVHKAVKRFGITTRLAQALAKQAKEIVRSQHKKQVKRKPRVRRHIVTLYYHFVVIEPGIKSFDWVVKFIGSGAPRLVIPVKSTKALNQKLADGWKMSKTLRLGIRYDGRVYIDFLVEKDFPEPKTTGVVVGMDSNYTARQGNSEATSELTHLKNGLVFSDGQTTGEALYRRTQEFSKRQKHTKAEIRSMLGAAFKQIDLNQIKIVVIEDLKKVKSGKRGTFSRTFNRRKRLARLPRQLQPSVRLPHWLYKYSETLLCRKCEELGIEVVRKNPWKTSQFCRHCFKWDRRNRRGDKFLCVNCNHGVEHADFNASKNLELLGLLGFYGIYDLQSSKRQTFE
ncbi:MAG: zinc ribbon domain-containing protein [Xenococcaceae cyanobacterium]